MVQLTTTNTVTSTDVLNHIGSNVWTHIAVTIDIENSNVSFYQDGVVLQEFDDLELDLYQNLNNLCIGYNSTENDYFTGNMDDFRIYNRNMNSNDIKHLYNTINTDKLLMKYDFEDYNVSRSEVYDESGYFNHGTVQNMTSSMFDNSDKTISSTSFSTSNAVTEYIRIPHNNTIHGSNIEQSTFAVWVKTSELNSFEPIVSREGIFSFGLNFGHACLRLGDGYQLGMLPSVKSIDVDEEEESSSTPPSTSPEEEPTIDLTKDLMNKIHFESEQTGVVRLDNPVTELNETLPGSKALTLSGLSNQHVEVDGSDYGSTDLSSFSFSGWVKFNNIPSVGELPIFNRGDGELKFGLSNGALVLGMMVNMMGNIELDLENYDQTSGTIPNKGTFQISEFTVSGTTKPSLEYDTDGTYIHLTRSNYIDLLSALPIINVTPNRTDITIFYTFKIVSINSVENFQFAIFGTDSRMYILITPDNINVAKIIIGSGTQVINGLPISVGDLYKVVISHNASTDMNKIYWYNATTDTMTERDITFGISQFDQSRFAINSGSSDVLDRPCDQKLYTFKMFNKYIDELQSVYTDFFT